VCRQVAGIRPGGTADGADVGLVAGGGAHG
jgi:hypothetical protein